MERKEFNDGMTDLGTFYGVNLPKRAIDMYWDALQHLGAGEMGKAVKRHVQDPTAGKWMPRPAEIITQVEQVRAARKWAPPAKHAALPAADADRMRGQEVPVFQRYMTLNEYMSLPDDELAALGQTRESVSMFKDWLEWYSYKVWHEPGGY